MRPINSQPGIGKPKVIRSYKPPVYASILKRITAQVADYILFCIFFFPATRIVKGVWLMMPQDHDWNYGSIVFDPICLVFLCIIFLYFILLEAYTGATFGKWITGIKVTDTAGLKPGLTKSLIRNILRLVDGIAINLVGIILILTTKQKTRLGDIAAGTRVILNK